MIAEKQFRNRVGPAISASDAGGGLETQIVDGSVEIANNIPRGSVKAFLAVPPPEQEQAELATIPRDEVAKLDQLTETGEIAMNLLQERRAALIVAAVTGKIDMRGFVQNQTETA